MMTLAETIPVATFNDAIVATFGFADIYTTPSWISDPITRWYELHQTETAINDDSTIMGYKLVATLAKYRDRVMVKYKQYTALINTIENPGLTSKTTSDNTLSNTTTNQTTNTSTSNVNDKTSQGMGGGDATNQTGNFSYTTDITSSNENATANSTGQSNETTNLVTSTTTTDAYMSLEGLKHEVSTIFTALMEDLSLTLLINIW